MAIGIMEARPPFNYKYQASASADVVIKDSAGYLEGIIIGKFVSGGVVEVSDHASDGDGNVKVYLETSSSDTGFPKYIPVKAKFSTGITADLTGTQSNVTFIYK